MTKKTVLERIRNFLSMFNKEAMVEILKEFAFYALLLIFLFMNVSFYVSSSKTLIEKIVMGSLVGSLEIVAVWLLFKIASIHVRKGWDRVIDIAKIAGLLIIYLGLSIPSISSRIAYTINAVSEQSKAVSMINSSANKVDAQNKLDLEAIDLDLSNLKDNLKTANSYSTNSNVVKWYKADLTAKINKRTKDRKLYASITNIATTNISTAEDAYAVMGQPFKVAGIFMFTALLIIRLFSLDICIILIVFLSKRKDKKSMHDEEYTHSKEKQLALNLIQHKENLNKYVDSLMEHELEDKKKLKIDADICAQTGIPLKLCNKYRMWLKKDITFGKLPVIASTQGSTKANFSKQEIKNIIYSYTKLY